MTKAMKDLQKCNEQARKETKTTKTRQQTGINATKTDKNEDK